MHDVAEWNPLTVVLPADYTFCYLLFSTLFTYDEDSNDTVPMLATGYSQVVNPNGTQSTTVDISSNAYFRNLADPEDTTYPVTSEDVRFTIETIMQNPGGAWDRHVQNITGVYATGPQVRIDTDSPKASLIDNLAWIPILPQVQWSGLRPSEILSQKSPYWLFGSGPFMFNNSLPGSWYRFDKAPNYHGSTDRPGSMSIDFGGLLYTTYSDPAALTLEMNSGNLDVVDLTGSPNLFLNTLGVNSSVPITRQAVTELGIIDVAINAIPPDFRTATYGKGNLILLDPVVRQAIGMTLDKETIADSILFGLAEVADSVLPCGYWHNNISGKLPFDPAGANALLEAHGYMDVDSDGVLETTDSCLPVQMGWVESGEPLQFRLDAPDSDPTFGLIGQAWVPWAAQAGIELLYSLKAESIMINTDWYRADYDVWVWSWNWDPEPLSNLATWRTSEIRQGGDNCQSPMGPWWFMADPGLRLGFSSFDENYSTAAKSLDVPAEKALVDALQQFIYDSYTEFPPVYLVGLFGYTETRFSGWGNWSEHIGRTMTSGLLWTWFDLEAVQGTGYPPEFVLTLPADIWTSKGVTTNLFAMVSDVDNDTINVTWDFGDGTSPAFNTTDPAASPQTVRMTHVYDPYYPGQGDFTVNFTLNVTLDDGNGNNVSRSFTVHVYIPYNMPPATPIITGPATADPSDVITITANSSDDEGEPLTWTFIVNNSVTDVLVLAKHTPATGPGEPVSANASFALGAEGLYRVSVYVSDALPPYQVFPHNLSDSIMVRTVNNSVPLTSPIWADPTDAVLDLRVGYVTVDFTIEVFDFDGDTLTVTWDFADGSPPVVNTTAGGPVFYQLEQSNDFTREGRFNVTATTSDGRPGHEVIQNITIMVTVLDHLPMASFSADPMSGDTGTIFTFDASGSSDIETPSEQLQVRWDFDNDGIWDTGWSTGKVQAHQFGASGTYTVVLEVMDGGGLTNVTTRQVEVAEPIPEFPVLTAAIILAVLVLAFLRREERKRDDTVRLR